MKTMAEKIRDLRFRDGLTQAELGEKIGVTARSVGSYESKGIVPRNAIITKLCEVFGVSRVYLTDDAIEDPEYGLEESPYIESARAAYGRQGAMDVQNLLTQTQMLFAGGDIPEEDKEQFFQAVTEAYFANKKRASEKFTRNDYKK